jgi:hypothetical protein
MKIEPGAAWAAVPEYASISIQSNNLQELLKEVSFKQTVFIHNI